MNKNYVNDKFDKWFDDNIDKILIDYKKNISDYSDEELNLEDVYKYAKEYIYEDYKNTPDFKCCICGSHCYGFGNNPYPVSKNENDRCCDDCNSEVVIPARLMNLK